MQGGRGAGLQLAGPCGCAASDGTLRMRAGAKFYARRGWSALAIQHLGRWSTSTVLAYIEEALAELPGGRLLSEDLPPPVDRLGLAERHLAELAKVLDGKERELDASYELAQSARADREASTPTHLVSEPKEGAARGKIHSLASRLPGSPAWAWHTTCGWHFARRSSNGRLATFPRS